MMKWTFFAATFLAVYSIAIANSNLQFITEPISRLVKISDVRAVFRCDASPPGSEIRWFHNGHPILHNRWIKVSAQKLTVLLEKMDNTSRTVNHLKNDIYFHCEIRFKGKVLVSAPAKLIVATLHNFSNQPDVNISAIVGNTAVIPCDPPYSVPTVVTEFLFNGSVISRSTANRSIMPSGDLQILNVTPEDAGEYTCIAYNPFLGSKVNSKRKVILHVEDPPTSKATTIIKSPRSKVSVALGTNITLECAASGYPTPNVTWRKFHGKLPHHCHYQIGGNLLLIGITRNDEGTYYCEAKNSIGPSEIRTTILEIQESPQIVKSTKTATVETGENLTLNCQIRGHPRPILKWFHNGKELISDAKKSHLIVPNVSHKNSGVYQCFASNDLGTAYASAVVTVTSGNDTMNFDDHSEYEDYDIDDHPSSHHRNHKAFPSLDGSPDEDDKFKSGRESSVTLNSNSYNKKRHKKKHSKGVKLIPPSKPDITRLSNTSVMVRWSVGNGGLPINFFKVQYKEVGKRKSDWMTIDEDIAAHIHSYAVTNLRTGGAYRFRIAAVYSNHDNKAGPISSRFVLYKDPPMEKPSIGPIITFAEAASPSAITLHWEYSDGDLVPIEGFFIHYRATHTAGKYLKVTVLGPNTRSHIISHLLPDTGYDMKMQCFNIAGTSDFSNIYTSKTKASDIVGGSRNRNSKSHDDDDEIEMSATEPVSSKNNDNGTLLYIVLGSVLGILVIAVTCICCVFVRQRQNREQAADDCNDTDSQLKVGNGHVSSNGYIPVNKININVNPLSHLDIESAEKLEELEDIVSNNNEIIRLQTFNSSAALQEEALLPGGERESTLTENDREETVISPSNPQSCNDLPTDL